MNKSADTGNPLLKKAEILRRFEHIPSTYLPALLSQLDFHRASVRIWDKRVRQQIIPAGDNAELQETVF